MQFPISIPIGNTTIQLHAITEFLGIFVGFRYFLFLRKRKGDAIESETRIIIIVAALFGSVVGSRMVGCLESIHQFISSENMLRFILQNKSIVGGLLGGLFGVELAKYFIKEKKRSGDLFVFPLLLSMIIGRIGCFSMGVYETTFGNESNFFVTMNLGDGKMRHPVMLYELVFLTLLWIVLYILKNNFELQSGMLFKLFLSAYLVFRFFIEFLKPNTLYFMHLGTIQIACLLGLLYYTLEYFLHKTNHFKN